MSATFSLERSWGAEILADGAARFRLWAPHRAGVAVLAAETGVSASMRRRDDGWFELVTHNVGIDAPYAFVLDDGRRVPDPAARAQAGDVHGPSLLVDPRDYQWRTSGWRGRPWTDAVVYEVHAGTFTQDGTFAAIEARLDHIAETGITAIELMPVAQFAGNRGWGYDGVLLYAPHPAYGGINGLKHLVDSAHARGLMVLLDVVYNHFGPDGNYLHTYAPGFFDEARQTPWGAAIDYTREPVRRFAIENALYWLEEYRIDGLRLDAIDQIRDPSGTHVLEELALEVRQRLPGRHIHLTTEDERNITRLHERDRAGRPRLYTAEWNDDIHHVAHVLATGEVDGYYLDYAEAPAAKLARGLAEGYVYQGEPSPYHDGKPRGEPSGHLPSAAFVSFLQNHDQIGNRAFGERLATLASGEAVELMLAILLLGPQVPLLFMGEEWGETRPFLFFTDFHGELADAVREGRRNEFRRWPKFADPQMRVRIPDPNAAATFEASRIDWSAPERAGPAARLALVKRLLETRSRLLAPRLAAMKGGAARVHAAEGSVVQVTWDLGDRDYTVLANVSPDAVVVPPGIAALTGASDEVAFEIPDGAAAALSEGRLPPWSGVFRLAAGHGVQKG